MVRSFRCSAVYFKSKATYMGSDAKVFLEINGYVIFGVNQ